MRLCNLSKLSDLSVMVHTAIIPIRIIGGGIFVFFILPYVIHKLINRK